MDVLSIPPAPPLSVAAEPPLLRFQGDLDRSNFRDLVAAAELVHAGGARRLRIDLSQTTVISLSGLVALYAIAELFEGRPVPDFDDGWATIRQMLDAAPSPPTTVPAVELVGVPDHVAAAISRAGLWPRFGGRALSATSWTHRPAA